MSGGVEKLVKKVKRRTEEIGGGGQTRHRRGRDLSRRRSEELEVKTEQRLKVKKERELPMTKSSVQCRAERFEGCSLSLVILVDLTFTFVYVCVSVCGSPKQQTGSHSTSTIDAERGEKPGR